jgi:hypothetical protein
MCVTDMDQDNSEPRWWAAPQPEVRDAPSDGRAHPSKEDDDRHFRRSKGARLPSRRPLVLEEVPQLHDPFANAFAVLDGISDGIGDPAFAPAVADNIALDGFVGWAEASLGLPPDAAADAAAAAYRQTRNAYKAAMHNVGRDDEPGVPRPLCRMLLLNLKLEIQKRVMRMKAAAATRIPIKTLPDRNEGFKPGSAALAARRSQPAFDASFLDIGAKFQSSRAQGKEHAGAAVKELETALRSSGINSADCHKVAAELVDAGASDLSSMVQLLQQDAVTLSGVGLQPSHVLRVLRNMAKQPAFAAEAPSFRLTWSED